MAESVILCCNSYILANIDLHTIIHQYLWNLLEINPTTMADVVSRLLLCRTVDGRCGI